MIDPFQFDDILEMLEYPPAIASVSHPEVAKWFERGNRRVVRRKLEMAGYVEQPYPDNASGMWRHNGRRIRVYVRSDLSDRDRFNAAQSLLG